MQSKAESVDDYVAELPEERRQAIEAIRRVILKNLDKDYEERMQYGMIGYCVPHRVFADGYHCDPKQPLPFAGLASQKNYMSLYLMSVYGHESEKAWFQEQWVKAGKKLDMGKVCVRFKKLEDVSLDVIGEAIRRIPAKVYIRNYLAALEKTGRGPKAESNQSPSAKKKASPKKKPESPTKNATAGTSKKAKK